MPSRKSIQIREKFVLKAICETVKAIVNYSNGWRCESFSMNPFSTNYSAKRKIFHPQKYPSSGRCGECLLQPLVQNWKFLCTRENTISDSSSYQTFTSSCVSSIHCLLLSGMITNSVLVCLYLNPNTWLAHSSIPTLLPYSP